MRADDSWHGSEDYPGPAQVDDFNQWEAEGWGPTRAEKWRTALQLLLLFGLTVLVWAAVILLITIGVQDWISQ